MMTDPTTAVAWGIQLSRLWIASGQDFPVGVKDVALEISKTKFPDPISCVIPHEIVGIDGMLLKRKKKNDWYISYDESVKVLGRVNFTIAHELGHYLLHRNLQDDFQCGEAQMMEYDSPASRRLESQANTFASYLLMPRNDFESQIVDQKVSFELIRHCANRYQTSLTATVLKWLEFTAEAAMLVVADSDNFICWSYCSKAARRIGAYIAPGEEVPLSVLANIKSRGSFSTVDRTVAPGVWHPTEEALESALASDSYEKIFFLIKFPFALVLDHEDELESDSYMFFEKNTQR